MRAAEVSAGLTVIASGEVSPFAALTAVLDAECEEGAMDRNQQFAVDRLVPEATVSASEVPSLPPLDPEWTSPPKARWIQFSPNREEVFDTFRFLYASTRRPRRTALLCALMIVLLVLIGASWAMTLLAPAGLNGGNRDLAKWGFESVAAAVVIVLLLGYMAGGRRRLERSIEELLADPEKGVEVLSERRITIGPAGCFLQGLTISCVLKWSTVTQIELSEIQCYLVDKPNSVLTSFPRRAFTSEHDFHEFVEMCKRFREDAGRVAISRGAEESGTAAELGLEPLGESSTVRGRASLLSPQIVWAERVPRPLCTPAERVGMFCVTWGFLLALVTPILATFLYLGICQELNLRPPRAYFVGSLATSAICLAVAALNDFFYAGLLFRLYLRWRTRRRILGRSDSIVSPDDPQAFFAQVVPQKNWYRSLKMENATDRGWLAIDRANHQLLFEGVRERWVIPARFIEQCLVQEVRVGPSARAVEYFAMFDIRDGQRVVELPLRARNLKELKNRPRERQQASTALALAINSLRQTGSLA
jgi:hypothetical protein